MVQVIKDIMLYQEIFLINKVLYEILVINDIHFVLILQGKFINGLRSELI